MTVSLRPPSIGCSSSSLRGPSRHRRSAVRGGWGLVAAVALVLSGCAGESGESPGQGARPAQATALHEMPRFPAPPDSRSMGAMDEPEDSLNLPLGAAEPSGNVPARRVAGRVFRRVSMVSTGARFDTLLEHYRGVVAEGGYEVVFECEGVEACGGERFVSEVIEGYVTAPANASRARMVLALTQPTSGDLGHFSLARDHAGVVEYVAVTVTRSQEGPFTVVTQQAFVVADD